MLDRSPDESLMFKSKGRYLFHNRTKRKRECQIRKKETRFEFSDLDIDLDLFWEIKVSNFVEGIEQLKLKITSSVRHL